MSSTYNLDYATRSRITRNQVLAAAVDVLIEDGYAGASTLKIQARAGVSRGRLLHQFPNRDLLLVAAAQHLAEMGVHETTSVTTWPTDPGARLDAAVDAMWATYHEGYFWAATELWLAARHHPSLANALSPGEHSLGKEIREATDVMFGASFTSFPRYSETRELLNTSMRGVALTYAFTHRDHLNDPHLPSWRALAHERLQ